MFCKQARQHRQTFHSNVVGFSNICKYKFNRGFATFRRKCDVSFLSSSSSPDFILFSFSPNHSISFTRKSRICCVAITLRACLSFYLSCNDHFLFTCSKDFVAIFLQLFLSLLFSSSSFLFC